MRVDDAAAKAAAVSQWTADPCGPEVSGQPGTSPYAEQLVADRRGYARWFADALDYRGAAGLAVLDVGCGQGIDVIEYARAGADIAGVDLTPRHVELASLHVQSLGLTAEILEGDAEICPSPTRGSIGSPATASFTTHPTSMRRCERSFEFSSPPAKRA